MNEIQVFQNPEFGKIRAIEIDGESWLVGKDVAEALGYSNTKDALITHVDNEDKRILQRSEVATIENHIPKSVFNFSFVPGEIPNRGLTIINESGLYSLIFSSKLPKAKEFKRWVTSEVLPTIRKTGGYGQIDMTAIIMQTATAVCTEMVKQLVPLLQTAQSAARPNPCFFAPANSLKLETFPPEIIQEVDGMLEDMVQQQALNFSMIARYCTMNGYTISSPSVKRYFDRHFNQD